MKRVLCLICCLVAIGSYEFDKRKNEKESKSIVKEPIENSTWLEYNHKNKKSDSVEIILHHYLYLDSMNSNNLRKRYGVFYFTFKNISDEKLKEISLLKDENKFDEKRDEYEISIIHIDSNQTKRSFYIQFPGNKVYHLTGLVQDNLLFQSKDSIVGKYYERKIGTMITIDIPFEVEEE